MLVNIIIEKRKQEKKLVAKINLYTSNQAESCDKKLYLSTLRC